MFGRFLPKETSFFDLFDKHASVIADGTREFVSMVTSGANMEAKSQRIKELEHDADLITHTCIAALHTTFITPIDRDSIHQLITRLDDIMDFLEAASERITLYEMRDMTPEIRDLADILARSADAIVEACKHLRDLKNTELILKRCVEINRLENEADAVLRRAVARLFREEKDPITIIKWKEVYENLESAADRCEDVANTIEGVILDHA
jgi:predicted phosphate transport protein (TIGR00153 family)